MDKRIIVSLRAIGKDPEKLKKPIPFEAIHRDKVAFDEKNLTRIDKMKRM
ncbi:hypothetical protein [Candidatus Cloacimonas acidaminovorans]|uniref:Uncharacterized protein n=1 Tax=Cloacimonas acidaminovorans (strain Evry) TaxID=459349 RepID=B0VIW0_CLOAI|nr:hypothetical protein [Candidatus Cloacimonas acidaminovorans]CAO80020.1 hypothetical protein CLOAM0109 [Candidatus Cloacimonas acidaminovorans str. Evry]